MADICTESGKLATPYCPTTLVESRLFVKRPVPYNPAENLDGKGNPIILRDSAYDLPIDVCDIHTAENATIEPSTSTPNTPDSYLGVKPTVRLIDGTLFVQRPYPIDLMDGSTLVLQVGSKINIDGSVTLADGSVLLGEIIKNIPNYTTEELDALNP